MSTTPRPCCTRRTPNDGAVTRPSMRSLSLHHSRSRSPLPARRGRPAQRTRARGGRSLLREGPSEPRMTSAVPDPRRIAAANAALDPPMIYAMLSRPAGDTAISAALTGEKCVLDNLARTKQRGEPRRVYRVVHLEDRSHGRSKQRSRVQAQARNRPASRHSEKKRCQETRTLGFRLSNCCATTVLYLSILTR